MLSAVYELKMEQCQYDAILGVLRNGKVHENMSRNQKISLQRKAKSFILKDGLLFYKDMNKKGPAGMAAFNM